MGDERSGSVSQLFVPKVKLRARIFGPLEQVVAAAVIIGLAMQYPPSTPAATPIAVPIQLQPSVAAATEERNSTSADSLPFAVSPELPRTRTNPEPAEGSGQAIVDLAIAFAARDWRAVLAALQDMSNFKTASVDIMSLAMIGMMGAIAWMLIPVTFKKRCYRAYQSFMQDPSSGPALTAVSSPSHPHVRLPDRASPASREAHNAPPDHRSQAKDRSRAPDDDPPTKASKSREMENSSRSAKKAEQEGQDESSSNGSSLRSSEERPGRSIKENPSKERENPIKSQSGSDDRAGRETEAGRDRSREKQSDPREMTDGQKAKERARRKAAEIAAQTDKPSERSSKAPSSVDGKERRKEKSGDHAGDVPEDRQPGAEIGKTQSERARQARARQEPSSDKPESRSGERDPRDKGKSRMDGERPPSSPRSAGSAGSKTSNDEIKQSQSSRPTLSRTSSEDSGDSGESGEGLRGEDDPLMAGDYRPLKSILKKPGQSKKGKKKKNKPTEHHNHFLAMRGWRPALVPFPHGLHPPPGEPRGTMWWNNIPRDARHLMVQKPAKEPEKDDEASDASTDKEDKEDKKDEKPKEDKKPDPGKDAKDAKSASSKERSSGSDEKKKSESERAQERKERGDKPPSSASSGDKEKEKEKREEMEKLLKAKQEAKAKAKEEAAAKEKAKARAQAEAASRPSPAAQPPSARSKPPVEDPQLSVFAMFKNQLTLQAKSDFRRARRTLHVAIPL